jgi:hypothetical protein
VQRDERPLFDPDREQDVDRHDPGEQQMPLGHGGRRPERDQESEHQRVADPVVEDGLFEVDLRVLDVVVGEPDLTQAEQVKVIDQERRVEDEAPPNGRDGPDGNPRDIVIDLPDDLGQRPPLPVHEQQDQAREQDKDAPLDRRRHDRRPPAFERNPRHDRVLNRKDCEQANVDCGRVQSVDHRPIVDRLRHPAVRNETDLVEEGDEEEQVHEDAEHEKQPTLHGTFLLPRRMNLCLWEHRCQSDNISGFGPGVNLLESEIRRSMLRGPGANVLPEISRDRSGPQEDFWALQANEIGEAAVDSVPSNVFK